MIDEKSLITKKEKLWNKILNFLKNKFWKNKNKNVETNDVTEISKDKLVSNTSNHFKNVDLITMVKKDITVLLRMSDKELDELNYSLVSKYNELKRKENNLKNNIFLYKKKLVEQKTNNYENF